MTRTKSFPPFVVWLGTLIAVIIREVKMKRDNSAKNGELNRYFLEIKKTPLLSFEEELELSRRVEAGEEAAVQKLVEANLRLVIKIARPFVRGTLDLMDLIQEGNIGLLRAAEKYDYRKKVRFATYASWWIKQSIGRALGTKQRQIRLPHRKDDLLRRLEKTKNSLSQELMRTPSVDELSRSMGVGRKEVLDSLFIPSVMISLDSEANGVSGTLHEVFADRSFDPERKFMRKAMREDAKKFMDTLRGKERQVFMRRFTLCGENRPSLKNISAEIGISPETVRQIEMRLIKRIREEASPLREYVYS
ncbi:MAG: RNA polymerase sigma factor RpoD/SigA [Spirochaetales bacterium]|jgi:RNA polymerase primary sigma factor|nr:RNA polymerase sigma factor RpoD/SigA [Spirochaetales bacterium]